MRAHHSPLNACLAAGAVAGLLLSCTNTVLVRPIEPGTTVIEKPGNGLVFGGIAIIRDGEDQLTSLPSYPKEFGWVLTHVRSGKRYVVSPLTQNGPFVLDLPAGSYEVTKLTYEERAGIWEGPLLARFTVQPDGMTYIGTWEIQFTNLGSSSLILGRVLNQLDEATDDLKQHYPGKSRHITVSLLDSSKEGRLSLLRPRAEQ